MPRRDILTIKAGECHYPLTADMPHMFCGDPVGGDFTSYCAHHHLICYTGFGKDPRALEEMIYGIENTVQRRRPSDDGAAPAVDEVVK